MRLVGYNNDHANKKPALSSGFCVAKYSLCEKIFLYQPPSNCNTVRDFMFAWASIAVPLCTRT